MPRFEAIGTLSLPDVLGRTNFMAYLDSALKDLFNLQDGGIDMILIENQGDKAKSRKALPQTIDLMARVMEGLRKEIKVPYLMAILPADYEASFGLAKRFDASGVWMDTLVDTVSPTYTANHVVIEIDTEDVLRHKDGIKLFTEVQARNFYRMLDEKPLEQSIEMAKRYADAICIVGENKPPSLGLVENARKLVGEDYPIGIAGKLNMDNIARYVGLVDFGVFFSYLRENGDYGKPIDKIRVKNIMGRIRGLP